MDAQNFHQDCCKEHKPLLKLLVLILTVFLLVLTVSFLVGIVNKIKEGKYIGRGTSLTNIITVNGVGEVYTKPDLALIDFSVITEAKTVAEALNANSKTMNEVINFIKSQGVEDKDLKTTSFNIYPRYEYEESSLVYPYKEGKRVLVAYEASQTLEVKVRELSKVGSIIEGASSKGANQTGDLRFTVDNQDEFKNQARGQAIEKAKDKANKLVQQLGVKLVRITNFYEGSDFYPYYYDSRALSLEEGIGGGGEVPQIETGENKITVNVSITYEIE